MCSNENLVELLPDCHRLVLMTDILLALLPSQQYVMLEKKTYVVEGGIRWKESEHLLDPESVTSQSQPCLWLLAWSLLPELGRLHVCSLLVYQDRSDVGSSTSVY